MDDSNKIEIMSSLNPKKYKKLTEREIPLIEGEEEDMMMRMEDTPIQSEGFINKTEMM